jgi:hypothetical protein
MIVFFFLTLISRAAVQLRDEQCVSLVRDFMHIILRDSCIRESYKLRLPYKLNCNSNTFYIVKTKKILKYRYKVHIFEIKLTKTAPPMSSSFETGH